MSLLPVIMWAKEQHFTCVAFLLTNCRIAQRGPNRSPALCSVPWATEIGEMGELLAKPAVPNNLH